MTITLTNGGAASATPSGPFTGTTDAAGHFSVTFTSNDAGKVTGHASSTLNLGSQQDPITVQTDGQGQNGSDAVKTFVDARIHITPTATNRVGSAAHVHGAPVEKNLGCRLGRRCAGETVTITLTNGGARVGDSVGSVHGDDERGRPFRGDVHVDHARGR